MINMNDINSITVCKEDYQTQDEFENAIKKAIRVLLDNNYIMTVRYDDKGFGIVAIDFNYGDQSIGGAYPYWLMPEEFESIITDKQMEDKKHET